MTPSEIGEISEAAVLAALTCTGKKVLVPFGGVLRYDFAYEERGGFVKVQCKTGRVRGGVVVFPACSLGRGPRRDYRSEADVFGVYCPERGEVYVVPVADVPRAVATLRLDPTKNGQASGIRWAADYLLMRHVPIPERPWAGGGDSVVQLPLPGSIRSMH